MQQTLFHNTTNEQGKNLSKSIGNAYNQEKMILEFFQRSSNLTYSPEEVWKCLYVPVNGVAKVPLTSVRRAISNLTTKGKLIKTDHQVKGMYGKQINVWRLNK